MPSSDALNPVSFAALSYRKGYFTDRHNLLTRKSTGGSFGQSNLAHLGGADFALPTERFGHKSHPEERLLCIEGFRCFS